MLEFSEIQKFKKELLGRWDPKVEVCGVITPDLEIQESPNLAPYPEDAFEFRQEDLEGMTASWHSHPKSSPNLSIPDFYFFKSWPSMVHFVIGKDEVRCFAVWAGTVYLIEQEEDHPSRLLEREVPTSD